MDHSSPKDGSTARSSGMALVCTVVFLGILLSFLIYIGVTMVFGNAASLVDTFWNAQNYDIPLSGYNNAYYKNQDLQNIITHYDYSLFGKSGNPEILVGRNNFLFEVIREDNNYNYLRDFLGEYAYDEESLANIYNFLMLRKRAYENQGVEYIVAVIPNAQTVYGENMPAFIRSSGGTTRLTQLSEYMRTKGEVTFINLTDALKAAKSAGVLYNNTENTLNSLGEYFVYQALYQVLPESVKAGTQMIEFSGVTFYTHYTDGKTLSRRAGLEGVVKNKTLSLSSSMEFNYSLQELYSGVEITSADHTEGNVAGQPILLEFSNEWDKIALMPYFSGTFDDVVYKSNHQFSMLAVESVRPALVIQFITEDALNSLTNNNTALSYNAGLNSGENPFIAASPTVTARVMLDDNTVCLVGTVEEGAVLSVYGDSNYRTIGTQGGQFFVTVDLADKEEVVIRLQASVENKNRSEVVKVTVSRGEDMITSPGGTLVGTDSRLFSSVYDARIMPDTGTVSVMKSELEEYRLHIVSYMTGHEVEFINVILPGALSVYAEEAPQDLADTIEEYRVYRNFTADLYRESGYTVLDMTDALVENRSLGMLYRLTEDCITDLGAFVASQTLLTYIGNDFPAVQIGRLSDYVRMTQSYFGGSLIEGLGLETSAYTETVDRLVLNASLVNYDRMAADTNGSYATVTVNDSLPVAIVIYSGEDARSMLDFLARYFRMMIVLPEGETRISDQMLTLFCPDYIIRLSSEQTPGLYDWNGPEKGNN